MKNREKKIRLLLEFMGEEPKYIEKAQVWAWSGGRYTNYQHPHKDKVISQMVENAKYDVYWSPLMAIVEKVESLGFPVEIFVKSCSVHRNSGETLVDIGGKWAKDKSKLEVVFKAMYEFIKWYNKNKVK
jgi:hypothetical protein